MDNITTKTIELTEYTAPDGMVFKKVETSVDDNGNPQEIVSYFSKLLGTHIDIDDYELVPVEAQTAQEGQK